MKRAQTLVVFLFLFAAPLGAQERPSTRPPRTGGKPFYFIQVTDTHFGTPLHRRRNQEVVEAIGNLPFQNDFVIVTGDITHDRIADPAAVRDARETLGLLPQPVYWVPGNHDILAHAPERTAALYREHFGPLAYRKEHKGVVFLFVCTDPVVQDYALAGYDPLTWVEAELARSDNQPVIVVHHIPSVLDLYDNELHRNWPPDARKRWVELLNRYRVNAVLAGHFHRDEHHWLGDVPLYICSPVAAFWGRQGTFRVFHWDGTRLSYRTRYVLPQRK